MANGSSYQVLFHHDVPKDLENLPANIQDRILKAIEGRLTQVPDQYGERLRQSLHGYWKLRVGDFRVVFEIVNHQVRVYGVMDRREVYTEIAKRTSKGWPEGPPASGRRAPPHRQ
ncbi:MAG TPA: type II toxin-antitoxin system RelE/ParE family toxin [Planctomycetota bacterium]|nr:type II toxin-antitoxin system RelE/ParE family toxin [Planctomycetota bacterium]